MIGHLQQRGGAGQNRAAGGDREREHHHGDRHGLAAEPPHVSTPVVVQSAERRGAGWSGSAKPWPRPRSVSAASAIAPSNDATARSTAYSSSTISWTAAGPSVSARRASR